MPTDTTAPTASNDKVLATVKRDGHTLTFVQHAGMDVIGVYEVAPLGTTPYLTALHSGGTASDGATALDLYRAVTTASPPAALVADDNRHGPGADTVVLPTDPAAGMDPANGQCEYNEAFAYDSQWASNWHFGIGMAHDLHAQKSFHLTDINGNVGRDFDANRSRARWLAACNQSKHLAGFPDIYLTPRVEQPNGWKSLYPLTIEPGTEGTYWSAGGPEHWKLRMTESITYNVENQRDWAIGGAIDKPFGFVANGG